MSCVLSLVRFTCVSFSYLAPCQLEPAKVRAVENPGGFREKTVFANTPTEYIMVLAYILLEIWAKYYKTEMPIYICIFCIVCYFVNRVMYVQMNMLHCKQM